MNNPSGLALVKWRSGDRPKIVAVARSYEEFLALDETKRIDWNGPTRGSKPDYRLITEKAKALGKDQVRIISLDIPLSPQPITSRRRCDTEVSSRFGRMGAAVHSPSEKCPGPIADLIYSQLVGSGYELLLNDSRRSEEMRGFMEVYPHIAIIRMLDLDYRLPYKVQKRTSYWKNATSNVRLKNIIASLESIKSKLDQHIGGVADFLPALDQSRSPVTKIKGYEDVLDAIVCAWMGYKYLTGEANAYGDETGVIWGPA
jgi:predicted RNase H-like nuclease